MLRLSSFSEITGRAYAAATKARKPASKERAGPVKQVLMKKKRESATASAGVIGTNRVAPLTQALFTTDPECIKAAKQTQADPEEMHRRRVIEMAWQQLCSRRAKEQEDWERLFLQSKLKAMDELEKVSPKLFKLATVIDYSLAPIHRRPATLTPPGLENFPYKQTILNKK